MDTTLYIGDLPDNTTSSDLISFFSGFEVSQPTIRKNIKGETYAILSIPSKDEHTFIEKYNYTVYNNHEIRICVFVPRMKKDMEGNLFLKLPRDMNLRTLFVILKSYGDISNLKLSHLPDGSSRGYGYVQYAKKESAAKALEDVISLLVCKSD